MNESLHLWLIPVLPFIGFVLNGLLGRRLPKAIVSAVALLAPLGSFAVVILAAIRLIPDAAVGAMPHIETFGTWITAGSFNIDVSFVLDQLSLVMLLIITGVGFLIHIYSVGYMHHEEGYWRYFAYLNLFLFFMTTLVLAGNALVMFVGWEGVGLASYLLIGFWFQKDSAANAGKKAFVVNRIGDFGFLIGLFLLLANFGTLTFSEIAGRINASPTMTGGVLTAIALCLFVGATGKSAQLPLYVWLPDAMEGPTPVSALIHAATMVTAGVYMVARTHFIFDRSPARIERGCDCGCCHSSFRSNDRSCADGHQARAGLFDGLATWLHVSRLRRRCVLRCDLPPDDPCILQGSAIPRGGLRHSCDERRTGHAQDGRPSDKDPDHLLDNDDGGLRDFGIPVYVGLLLEGRDSRRCV